MSAADWIDNLERKAKAATPGPWRYGGQGWVFAPGREVRLDVREFADQVASTYTDEDGAWIAAANPATILRLIGEVHRWKAAWEMASPLLTARDALAARLAAVEALADETERAGDPLLRLDRLRAALSTAPTDTDKENNR